MTVAVDWDAATYHRVANNQEEWGAEVLGRLDLDGDETVLDAGCGSGRVTRLLLERLPEGRVIGIDASPSMIAEARSNLEEFGDRANLQVQDLLDLDLESDVDAAFSNATFHWVSDHDRLFGRIHAALRPGGRLEAQCGGEGNVAEWKRAIESAMGDERFAPYFRGMSQPYNFASVDDTEARLERAGFSVRRVWLEQRSVEPSEPRDYVRSVGLSPHLARVPDAMHDDFIDLVLGSMLRPLRLEYVRLNISAEKGGEAAARNS
ncbi:MAG: class I SAM-dependent methyltransferase [Solirubrobacterales bacterium]